MSDSGAAGVRAAAIATAISYTAAFIVLALVAGIVGGCWALRWRSARPLRPSQEVRQYRSH